MVIDRLTKYAHFCEVQSTYTAKQVVEVFMNEIDRLHGFTKVIICDTYPNFIGIFWKYLWKIRERTLDISLTYHPQIDDQTKIVDKYLEGYLHCYYLYKKSRWFK